MFSCFILMNYHISVLLFLCVLISSCDVLTYKCLFFFVLLHVFVLFVWLQLRTISVKFNTLFISSQYIKIQHMYMTVR